MPIPAALNLGTLNGRNGFRIEGATASEGSGLSVASAGFAAILGFGTLAANRFVSGTNRTANQGFGQFLFNTAQGQLLWDADGTGGAAPTLIASVFTGGGNGLASLAASDIQLF
jgi:hypothetical protein